MENEMVLFNGYYMEKNAYISIVNSVKRDILTQDRIEAKRQQRILNKKKKERQERKNYFRKQKMFGLFEIIVSLVLLMATKQGFCLFGALIGFYTVITKEMVIVNDYFKKYNV